MWATTRSQSNSMFVHLKHPQEFWYWLLTHSLCLYIWLKCLTGLGNTQCWRENWHAFFPSSIKPCSASQQSAVGWIIDSVGAVRYIMYYLQFSYCVAGFCVWHSLWKREKSKNLFELDSNNERELEEPVYLSWGKQISVLENCLNRRHNYYLLLQWLYADSFKFTKKSHSNT